MDTLNEEHKVVSRAVWIELEMARLAMSDCDTVLGW